MKWTYKRRPNPLAMIAPLAEVDEALADYMVTCARCGMAGTSAEFIVEEGDEWECPSCWKRAEVTEREALK